MRNFNCMPVVLAVGLLAEIACGIDTGVVSDSGAGSNSGSRGGASGGGQLGTGGASLPPTLSFGGTVPASSGGSTFATGGSTLAAGGVGIWPGNGGTTTSSGGARTGGTGGSIITTGGGGAAGGAPTTGGANAKGGTSTGGSSSGGAGSPNASGGVAGAGTVPHGACLDGITAFNKEGPFKVTNKTSGSIKFYVPGVPAGCKVPVVHLANGTGASCVTYLAALQRLGTHGFLAACYESANTGAGDQGLKALDAALADYPDLADKKFGSTGHSQGGQAAFTVLALAEKKYGDLFIYAGLAIEPASGFGAQPTGATWQALYGGIKSPMFMFSGLGSDGLVSQSWVQQAYDATSKTEEAYFWTANGATHIPVPNAETQEISIPWFRWKLLGDQAACKAFKAIPTTNAKWKQVAAKNEQACR